MPTRQWIGQIIEWITIMVNKITTLYLFVRIYNSRYKLNHNHFIKYIIDILWKKTHRQFSETCFKILKLCHRIKENCVKYISYMHMDRQVNFFLLPEFCQCNKNVMVPVNFCNELITYMTIMNVKYNNRPSLHVTQIQIQIRYKNISTNTFIKIGQYVPQSDSKSIYQVGHCNWV